MNLKEFKQDYLPHIAEHFDYLFENQKFRIKQDGETCIFTLKSIYCGMIEVINKKKIDVLVAVTDTLKENLDIEIEFYSMSGFSTSVFFFTMNKTTKKIKKVQSKF